MPMVDGGGRSAGLAVTLEPAVVAVTARLIPPIAEARRQAVHGDGEGTSRIDSQT